MIKQVRWGCAHNINLEESCLGRRDCQYGFGRPPRAVSSADLAHRLEVTDEWIRSRTGIRERHVASAGGGSKLIVPAAVQYIEHRIIAARDADCCLTMR